MSTAIGQTLVDQIMTDLGLTNTDISVALQSALALRFDQMYEKGPGFFGDNQLAAVLLAVPGSKTALESKGHGDLLDAGAIVGAAVDNAGIVDPVDPVEPVALELTPGTDVIEGTAGDDTIEGTTATLQATDIIIGGEGDDTLNLIATGPLAAATISGVETINIDSQMLVGTGINLFDASNTKDATVNITMSKFGNDGKAEMSKVGDLTVNAGAGVKNLQLTGVESATVDAGTATKLAVTTVAATDKVGIAINNNIVLALDASTAPGATFTVTGAGKVNLTGSTLAATDVVDATGLAVTGAQVASAATLTAASATVVADADVKAWTVDNIIIGKDAAITLTDVADAQVVTVAQAMAQAITVDGLATKANTVSIASDFDLDAVTTSEFTTTNLELGADVEGVGALAVDSGSIVLSGAAADVTVADIAGATILDASALAGDLTLTANTAAIEVIGAKGATAYTTLTATNTFVGQGGADEVTLDVIGSAERFVGQFGAGDNILDATANINADATVIATFGAGNDTVNFDGTVVGTFDLDGGTGTDTINVADASDFMGATLTLTNFNQIQVDEAAGLTATFKGSQLSASTYEISIADYETGDLEVTVTADKAVLDLSGLTFDADQVADDAITFLIDDASTATSITGTSVSDEITVDTATSITTGAGEDNIVLTGATSTADAMIAITDFAISATDDFDTLTFGGTFSNIADTSAPGDAKADLAAVFGDAANAVTYEIADGVVTFAGTKADLGLFDKLSEAATIADKLLAANEHIAIEFGTNTYIFQSDGTSITNAIELTGVTGVDALGSAQAADTIVFA